MDQFISEVNSAVLSANVREPIIVYVGVGTAAGTFTMIGNHKIVESSNYHQYPQVLRDMENIIDGRCVKKYILLIDPCMEDEPHITQDGVNGFIFVKKSANVYYDSKNQIHLHIMRENIVHDAYKGMYNMDVHNITQELTQLIEICKINHINMIYHDFSGRQLLPIYEYHENQIGYQANHIIIGLAAQGDYGCYFDLLSSVATFAMKYDIASNNRSFINICSPRYYLKQNMTIDQALSDYAHSNECVLRDQFTRICKDKFDELVSRVFYKLRFLKHLQSKNNEELDKITIEDLYQMFGEHLSLTILQRIEDRNLETAFIEALEFYGPQYDVLCMNHKLPYSGIDLLYLVISDAKDTYSWATELRKYVNY